MWRQDVSETTHQETFLQIRSASYIIYSCTFQLTYGNDNQVTRNVYAVYRIYCCFLLRRKIKRNQSLQIFYIKSDISNIFHLFLQRKTFFDIFDVNYSIVITVQRLLDERFVKLVWEEVPTGRGPLGRPRKRWRDVNTRITPLIIVWWKTVSFGKKLCCQPIPTQGSSAEWSWGWWWFFITTSISCLRVNID